MKFTQKQVVIILGGAFLVILIFVIVIANLRGPGGDGGGVGGNNTPKTELTFWGTDDSTAFKTILDGYGKYRSTIKVNYEKIDENNYESKILDALASGKGPDIFEIGNRAVQKWQNKIAPVGPTQFDLIQFRDLYPTVAEQDFVRSGQIVALPLYIDTLALFYNKDFFDGAVIVSPPKTWQDFQNDVASLRVLDQNGGILRAGAAIGGSEKSVNGAVDLLSLIMLQNGAKMTDDGLASAEFNGSQNRKNPGLEAFNFYLQFANAASSYYTWNDSQMLSLDSFASEKTAMAFGYHEDIKSVKDKNPFLNFSVSAVPQLEGAAKAVGYAKYQGLAVSGQSKNGGWAWDFVLYAAARPELVKTYLDKTNRPPAIRQPLIADKVNDTEFGVFARQALTARSWADPDEAQTRDILSGAISSVLNGQRDSARALSLAEGQVTELMRKLRD